MTYVYSLRFAVDPGRTDQYSLAQLPEYVRAARIDDVMVFANVEELNTGHTDLPERALFRDLAERTAKTAAAAGASMSLNPWHTVMHGDYGKRLRAGQTFQRMVDPRGRMADLVVCPRDEQWRAYLAELYAYYAETQPRFLWIEDDFRYHNHPPLWWGGCFCDEHLAEFSRRAGRELDREEFVAGILRPGAPGDLRRVWLETAREALEDTAAAIERSVHAVSPGTRLGLMTSVPAVHAAEGRNWGDLLGALSGPLPGAVRIHLPAYSERAPADYLTAFHVIADLHRALLPASTEVYPELENFPYSRFSKSRSFTRFQLLSAQVLGVSGMTLDLFDLNGNGIVWSEGYHETLADVKGYLERTAPVFRGTRRGIVVLVSEESAAAIHTAVGAEMPELYPREGFFGGLFGAYGIAFRYSTQSEVADAVVAVSGQLFRTIGADATRRLFARNRLILDAEAVDTLIDMGLGGLVAAGDVAWSAGDAGVVTYEEATPGTTLLQRNAARASLLLIAADIAQVSYDPARARSLTTLRAAGHADRGPGHVVVDGRALVVPFGRIDPLAGGGPMVRTTMRQEMLHGVLEEWDAPVARVEGCADVALYEYECDGETVLYLVNASSDRVPRLRLRVPGCTELDRVLAEPSAGEPFSPAFSVEGGRVVIQVSLGPLEAVVLRLA